MKTKYLLLLLAVPLLIIALTGCGKKRHYAAPPPEPNAPSNLTATAVNYKQVHLTWQDNCNDEDYFRVLCPTMWGIQHQTIATLPPNTTSFDHHNLQPMTEYEYYVCVHRGEEHTCSSRAYATTPCPVTILNFGCSNVSDKAIHVGFTLQSDASEPCQVKIIFYFSNQDTGELVETEEKTFSMEPVGVKVVEFVHMLHTQLGVICTCEAEITDVEIEY